MTFSGGGWVGALTVVAGSAKMLSPAIASAVSSSGRKSAGQNAYQTRLLCKPYMQGGTQIMHGLARHATEVIANFIWISSVSTVALQRLLRNKASS